MSNYHVLEISANGERGQASVVMHIATPLGNNLKGTSYADALSEVQGGSVVSAVSGISVEEQAALNDGSLFEYMESVTIHRDMNNSTKQARLDAAYTEAVTREQAKMKERLWGWGFERNVP